MTLVHPILRSRVVGDLACQRDSYLGTLETEVVSCVQWIPQNVGSITKDTKSKASKDSTMNRTPSKMWMVEFADSVLFPEGGGQPSDHGNIFTLSSPPSDPIPITFVQRQGLHCVCHSLESLPPGTHVRQEVDFRRRWDHMQQHTGQHLLSAIMDTCDNLKTLSWGMGVEGETSYVEVPRKLSEEEIRAIQDKCNETIRNNLKITVETPINVKNDSLPDDYDKDNGVIRVVKIGDLDNNTCCGTHLSQTSHISLILLHSIKPGNSGNFRLHFTAGERAINFATSSIHVLSSIAKSLSSGGAPAEVLASFKKTNDIFAELKKKETKMLMDIAKYEGDRTKAVLQAGKNAWVYRATPGLDFINMVLHEIRGAIDKSGVVLLASGEEKKGGQVVITGDQSSVEGLATKVKEIVTTIRGGGKGNKWQGKVIEWKKGELEALKSLVE